MTCFQLHPCHKIVVKLALVDMELYFDLKILPSWNDKVFVSSRISFTSYCFWSCFSFSIWTKRLLLTWSIRISQLYGHTMTTSSVHKISVTLVTSPWVTCSPDLFNSYSKHGDIHYFQSHRTIMRTFLVPVKLVATEFRHTYIYIYIYIYIYWIKPLLPVSHNSFKLFVVLLLQKSSEDA